MLKFSDGINIDTSGELRTLTLHDGEYVVGNGMCIPTKDMTESLEVIKKLKGLQPEDSE